MFLLSYHVRVCQYFFNRKKTLVVMVTLYYIYIIKYPDKFKHIYCKLKH